MYYRAEASLVHNRHGYTHTKCIHISYEYVLPKASISMSKLLVEIACHPFLYLHHAVKIAFVMLSLSVSHSFDSLLSIFSALHPV